jgi:hypothetical protein
MVCECSQHPKSSANDRTWLGLWVSKVFVFESSINLYCFAFYIIIICIGLRYP